MTVAVDARKTLTPPPLHVALPGALAEEVRQEAERRGDHPQVLVAALMRRLLDQERVDEVMGEAVAAREAPGQGRRPLDSYPQGLTQRQCGVIYVLGFHADDDGVFRKPIKVIGLVLRGDGSTVGDIGVVLSALRIKNLTEQVPGRDGARHWRLTKAGQSVFDEISEEGE
ncbi:hypothetical protein WHT83_14895 [Aminobacter sp. P9b]|uniref:hypothetical protein n=1 Tax=Aminobacter sp. P9b TaxID=3133697 RepID=UPI0032492DC6